MADPVAEAQQSADQLDKMGQASDILTEKVTEIGAKVSGNQQEKSFAGRI